MAFLNTYYCYFINAGSLDFRDFTQFPQIVAKTLYDAQ